MRRRGMASRYALSDSEKSGMRSCSTARETEGFPEAPVPGCVGILPSVGPSTHT